MANNMIKFNILNKTRQGINLVLIECITLTYIVRDRRVRWYKKMILIVPFMYILSPIDLIPDAIPIVGHLDDLFVLRMSYFILKKLINQDIINENRKNACDFLINNQERGLKILFFISIIWIVLVSSFIYYLIKKIYFK
jgi:uncharacterized membrane protein YkvA (DUF1232 family)